MAGDVVVLHHERVVKYGLVKYEPPKASELEELEVLRQMVTSTRGLVDSMCDDVLRRIDIYIRHLKDGGQRVS